MKKSKNILSLFGLFLLSFFAACDDHEYIEPYTVGNSVLCTTGEIMDTATCRLSGKTPIAIVFHTTGDSIYAVWIKESTSQQYSDHATGLQGASTSISDNDGFSNTTTLIANDSINSPLAQSVIGVWSNGQSAFIPSVNEMNLLQAKCSIVNEVLLWCQQNYPSLGTVLLPSGESDTDCWYWTSTEVNSKNAYLYSIRRSSSEMPTPKTQKHKSRPIIMIRK